MDEKQLAKLREKILKQKEKQKKKVLEVEAEKIPIIIPVFQKELKQRKNDETNTRSFLSSILNKNYSKYLNEAYDLYYSENKDKYSKNISDIATYWNTESDEIKRKGFKSVLWVNNAPKNVIFCNTDCIENFDWKKYKCKKHKRKSKK
jgi:hypothetical protein